MKPLSISILFIMTLVGCERKSPELNDVLVDFVDDLPHLMVVQDVDSVIWILRSEGSYEYDFNRDDTVYKLYKKGKDTIHWTSEEKNRNRQMIICNSIGLPILIQGAGTINYERKISWFIGSDFIYKVKRISKTPDTTFYSFRNGRVESRLEKRGGYDGEFAVYNYDSSGRLKSITDTMIREVNHHYHKYEKEYFWNDSILTKVNEVFIPGKKRLTLFDTKGFPKTVIESFEDGDSVIFEIIKL